MLLKARLKILQYHDFVEITIVKGSSLISNLKIVSSKVPLRGCNVCVKVICIVIGRNNIIQYALFFSFKMDSSEAVDVIKVIRKHLV